jgi:hypothetical protein
VLFLNTTVNDASIFPVLDKICFVMKLPAIVFMSHHQSDAALVFRYPVIDFT